MKYLTETVQRLIQSFPFKNLNAALASIRKRTFRQVIYKVTLWLNFSYNYSVNLLQILHLYIHPFYNKTRYNYLYLPTQAMLDKQRRPPAVLVLWFPWIPASTMFRFCLGHALWFNTELSCVWGFMESPSVVESEKWSLPEYDWPFSACHQKEKDNNFWLPGLLGATITVSMVRW